MSQDTNYDTFAKVYNAENETSLLNAYYERPAMLKLAGQVRGKTILDVGCGGGVLIEELVRRGATVDGFDASEAMLDIARRRLGDQVDLQRADLGAPLPYAENTFDDACASLVFHYLQDWGPSLTEMRRVLKPGGRLLMSVNHPLLYPLTHQGVQYFKTTKYTDELEFNGQPGSLSYWHRPLHAMSDAFAQAGFSIELISEPPYSKDAPDELIPENLKDRDAFLSFVFFVLRAG
ncbi:class I SAM-dependent methyltransferase [Arthrobacter sp. MYb213]|uniref:class I SAM-dependent methyltransferase n=1 Tax=Arthrobacter sp. MYb213 TaxID=1848595 RepID=UPI000CFC55C6|nr:class I SAM-dependent methyltransferase [Arthrobacter sp. MYb213]PRB72415.1 SAM-dependent methyltransferase [Arthrobacter sp. MYb213]